jgi:VanZ family protein
VTTYQRTSWLLKLGFWLAVLFASYMAFAPHKAIPIPFLQVSGVILHAVTFVVLTYGLRLAYLPKAWLAASACMLLYGVGIEIVQGFTPERASELNDVIMDILGIAIGTAAYRLMGPWSLGWARRLVG